ncbi:hypothetical protein [Wukongibacter sp. M2B1]|uniref:hypothetical protein n=1 Tax=Wukongibacter sp. M2B1 TaxID=3088895 RepID=UPI003D7954B9
MKKKLIIPLIIIIGVAIITFVLEPSHEGKRIIEIGELDIKSFDFAKIYNLSMDNRIIKPDTYIDEFTMTILDNRKIVSMNFSIIEDGAFSKKRITVHLNSRDDNIVLNSEVLEQKDISSVEKIVYSFSKFIEQKRNNIAKDNVLLKNNFNGDELSKTIEHLKEPIIDNLETNKKLHIDMLSRAYYNIYEGADIYLVSKVYDEITDIKEVIGDEGFRIVKKNGQIESYEINNLMGIWVFGNINCNKYYFIDEN